MAKVLLLLLKVLVLLANVQLLPKVFVQHVPAVATMHLLLLLFLKMLILEAPSRNPQTLSCRREPTKQRGRRRTKWWGV